MLLPNVIGENFIGPTHSPFFYTQSWVFIAWLVALPSINPIIFFRIKYYQLIEKCTKLRINFMTQFLNKEILLDLIFSFSRASNISLDHIEFSSEYLFFMSLSVSVFLSLFHSTLVRICKNQPRRKTANKLQLSDLELMKLVQVSNFIQSCL